MMEIHLYCILLYLPFLKVIGTWLAGVKFGKELYKITHLLLLLWWGCGRVISSHGMQEAPRTLPQFQCVCRAPVLFGITWGNSKWPNLNDGGKFTGSMELEKLVCNQLTLFFTTKACCSPQRGTSSSSGVVWALVLPESFFSVFCDGPSFPMELKASLVNASSSYIWRRGKSSPLHATEGKKNNLSN